MGSDERVRRIRIGGSPVVELDFGQVAVRIVYGMAGATPTWTDAYSVPGLSGRREDVKVLVNAMVNKDSPVKRYPAAWQPRFRVCRARKPCAPSKTSTDPLATQRRPRWGQEIAFVESSILVDVLLDLMTQGIVALPIHDALFVGEHNADAATRTMLHYFQLRTGVQGVVTVTG